jgi:hypothetical protein
VVGQQHKRINREEMLTPHGDDGGAAGVSANFSTQPGIALIGDMGEELTATRSVKTTIIGHEHRRSGWYQSAQSAGRVHPRSDAPQKSRKMQDGALAALNAPYESGLV